MKDIKDFTPEDLEACLINYVNVCEAKGRDCDYLISRSEKLFVLGESYLISDETVSAFRCMSGVAKSLIGPESSDSLARLLFFVSLFRTICASRTLYVDDILGTLYGSSLIATEEVRFSSLLECGCGLELLAETGDQTSWLIEALNYVFLLMLFGWWSGRQGGLYWMLSQFPDKYRGTAFKIIEMSRVGRFDEGLIGLDLDEDMSLPGLALGSKSVSETVWRLRSRLMSLEVHQQKARSSDSSKTGSIMKDWIRKAKRSEFSIALPVMSRDDFNEWSWNLRCAYYSLEPGTVLLLSRLSSRAGWFLDGGAHVGYISAVVRAFNDKCHVMAVEPNADLFEVLLRNLSKIDGKHLGCALSSGQGVEHFYRGTGHSNGSLLEGATSSDLAPVEVVSNTIDNVLEGARGDGIIKLDLESFEFEALLGARKVLERSDSIVILEVNPKLLEKKKESVYKVSNLMEELGYYGRCITDSFDLLPAGFVEERATRNYVFCKPGVWNDLLYYF